MRTRRRGPGSPAPAGVRRPRWRARLLGRLLILLAVAGSLWLAATEPAGAHDVLVATNPAADSTVRATPADVVLTFDQPALGIGTAIKVAGPAGDVADGPPQLVDNDVRQRLRPGSPAGHYTVSWRVTSADGHPVSGTFAFTSNEVGAGTASGLAPGATAGHAPAVAAPRAGLLWLCGAAVVLVVAVLLTVRVAVGRRGMTATRSG